MVFFRRKPIPPFDVTEGHPLVERGLQAFHEEDWLTLGQLYDAQTTSDADHFIRLLGDMTEVDTLMPRFPENPSLLTVQGGIQLRWAGRYRGGDVGSAVSAEMALNMRRCAKHGLEKLLQASEMRPDCSVLASHRVDAALRLFGDRDELTAAQAQFAASAEPRSYFFAHAHLHFEAPKWYGSLEAMWDVANNYADNPASAVWLTAKATAYIEEWLYIIGFSDDEEEKKAYRERRRSEVYRQEITDLNTAFWDLYAANPLTGSEATRAHNTMAFLLWRKKMGHLMAPHLEKIGPNMSEMPWGYTAREGEEMKLLGRLRKKAGLPRLW